MNKTLHWIWLSVACGPGTSLPKRLLGAMGDNISAIYNAQAHEYPSIRMSKAQRERLCDKSLDYAKKIYDWCSGHKVNILCYDDPMYPDRLRSIIDPPIVLYYIGELYNIDSLLCLGCVGTRTMTNYGKDLAYSFSFDLARSGAVIVSGLAAGIDSISHRGALDSGGKTIAVIGCRINKVYPVQNRELMREIARKGLLITEYHPFFETQASNFPKRNRIISGLCQGTIIFEADANSGSLITAKYAREQDRLLFSLPGRIGEKGALGTNHLIRNGAISVTRVSDIIGEFSSLYKLNETVDHFDYSPLEAHRDSYPSQIRTAKAVPDRQCIREINISKEPDLKAESIVDEKEPDISDPLEKEIYSKLSHDTPLSIEAMCIDRPIGDIMTALTMLELSGYIKSNPGNTYTKTN